MIKNGRSGILALLLFFTLFHCSSQKLYFVVWNLPFFQWIKYYSNSAFKFTLQSSDRCKCKYKRLKISTVVLGNYMIDAIYKLCKIWEGHAMLLGEATIIIRSTGKLTYYRGRIKCSVRLAFRKSCEWY